MPGRALGRPYLCARGPQPETGFINSVQQTKEVAMYAAGTMVAEAAFFPWPDGIDPLGSRPQRSNRRRRASLMPRLERWLSSLLHPAPAMVLKLRQYPY